MNSVLLLELMRKASIFPAIRSNLQKIHSNSNSEWVSERVINLRYTDLTHVCQKVPSDGFMVRECLEHASVLDHLDWVSHLLVGEYEQQLFEPLHHVVECINRMVPSTLLFVTCAIFPSRRHCSRWKAVPNWAGECHRISSRPTWDLPSLMEWEKTWVLFIAQFELTCWNLPKIK